MNFHQELSSARDVSGYIHIAAHQSQTVIVLMFIDHTYIVLQPSIVKQ